MPPFLDIVSALILLFGSVYLFQVYFFRRGLENLPAGNNKKLFSISIIIAARNEEAHIGQCIRSLIDQEYPTDLYEIIIVDDQSSDDTASVVRKLSLDFPQVKLLSADARAPTLSPKITALSKGIEASKGEIIFTTDADCFASPQWLQTMVRFFEEDVGVVTGITIFTNSANVSRVLFGIQFLDYLSHTACAAGAIGMNSINNCNGSNMAFRRSAFDEVGGYRMLAHLNSGDDSLLAQQIAHRTRWAVRFAPENNGSITTHPVATWKEFLQQRMRWAAQTAYYRPGTLIFLISSFLFYALLFTSTPVAIVVFPSMPAPLFMLAAKLAFDFWIMRKFTGFARVPGLMRYFFPAEIVHIPSILVAVICGLFGTFQWKGRALRRSMAFRT